MINLYGLIMDPDKNPLRNLPIAQRFQLMLLLGMMWTTIFCASFSLWFYYGELAAAHILFAIGFVVTGLTFQRSAATKSYRDYPSKDGTNRYDDVWGG